MFILLPPSEGKTSDPGKRSFRDAHPDWASNTAEILAHLAALPPDDRARFLGAPTPEKAASALATNLQALDSPGVPALERYAGVVYTHLGYASLKRKAAARRRVLVVSALFGLITGGAPIPPYKLSMNPWLARHWCPINTQRLAAIVRGKPVLDLLSQSYRPALAHPTGVQVEFRVQGGRKAAGHFGKAIKGRFVRWLLENDITNTADLAGFSEDGYRFDGRNFVQS